MFNRINMPSTLHNLFQIFNNNIQVYYLTKTQLIG